MGGATEPNPSWQVRPSPGCGSSKHVSHRSVCGERPHMEAGAKDTAEGQHSKLHGLFKKKPAPPMRTAHAKAIYATDADPAVCPSITCAPEAAAVFLRPISPIQFSALPAFNHST